MFKFDLQIFGGGGKKSKVRSINAKVPEATADEKQLLQGQMNWINNTNRSANTFRVWAMRLLGNELLRNMAICIMRIWAVIKLTKMQSVRYKIKSQQLGQEFDG